MPLQADLPALWLSATRHFDAGDVTAAAAACEALIARAPDRPMAYSMLSRVWHMQGRVRPTTLAAFHASQRAQGSPWPDVLAISEDLVNVGESHLAHSLLGFVDPALPANQAALLPLGRQYSTLEDQPRSLACIEQAMATGTQGAFVEHMLGIVRSFTGPIDAAVAACERSIALAPTYGHAHWSRAQFGLVDGAEARVARMREVLRTPELGVDDATFIHYALFKELDTLDQPEAAFASLMAGARARRSATDYDARVMGEAFDSLIAATSGDYMAMPGDVDSDSTPIFIVGMPRTGTTLLERILGNHPDVTTCGELNDFKQQMQWVNDARLPLQLDGRFGGFVAALDHTLLGRRYLEKTRWLAKGRRFYSDKHPINFMWAGPIMKALPHAKILHLRRDPMDTCFSNLKELFAKSHYAYSYALDELASYHRHYDRLMQHWHAIAPGRILDVHYEDLVADPEHAARRVQDYLGLPHADGVTDILANTQITTTASTLQLRQPIHRRNVGGWQRYAAGLEPLRGMLYQPKP